MGKFRSKTAIIFLVACHVLVTYSFLVPTIRFHYNDQSGRLHPTYYRSTFASYISASNVDTAVIGKKKSRRKKKQQPWKADYMSSRKTQEQITSASKHRKGDSVVDCAIRVLTTLLNTPPTLCNEANLVHALTLTAKILSRRPQPSTLQSHPKSTTKEDTFLEYLYQTLNILHDRVAEGRLNTRQLSNAAWAVAKHYSMDCRVLLPSPTSIGNRPITYDDGEKLIQAETWDLGDDESDASSDRKKHEHGEQVLETLERIAERLISVMKMTTGNQTDSVSTVKMQPLKTSELSMVCWAYAVLNPRKSPPGWELPPRSGRMIGELHRDTSTVSKDTVVSFEKWDKYAFQEENMDKEDDIQKPTSTTEEKSKSINITNKLFDSISIMLLKYDLEYKDNGKKENDNGARMIQGCLWRELSNIAWAYAHTAQQSDISLQLMQVLTDEASRRLQNHGSSLDMESGTADEQQFLPRDVSQIAWALGSLQRDNYRFSDALLSYVETITTTFILESKDDTNTDPEDAGRPFRTWRSADLVQVAVALAHSRIDKPELLRPIYAEVLQSTNAELYEQTRTTEEVKMFKSWELAVLLWVQARLYMTGRNGRVFEEFADTVPPLLLLRMHGRGTKIEQQRNCTDINILRNDFKRIGLGVQEQANIAWSLTVLEKYKSPESIQLLKSIFTVCSASCAGGNPIELEHVHQLWQTVCILEDQCREALGKLEETSFYSFMRESWFREKSRPKMSSARHKSISKLLNLMGVQHFNEHDEDIDVAIVLQLGSEWTHTADKGDDTKDKRKVAVEFDGPNHFTRPNPSTRGSQKSAAPRALGHTVLKYKILKKQGWTVVRVPYYEFDKIPFWASMERQRYLQRKLKTHANIRFSSVDVSEYKVQVPNRQSRFD